MTFLPRYFWCSACHKARANNLANLYMPGGIRALGKYENTKIKHQYSNLILQFNPQHFLSQRRKHMIHMWLSHRVIEQCRPENSGNQPIIKRPSDHDLRTLHIIFLCSLQSNNDKPNWAFPAEPMLELSPIETSAYLHPRTSVRHVKYTRQPFA